jgi:hypothetical protein
LVHARCYPRSLSPLSPSLNPAGRPAPAMRGSQAGLNLVSTPFDPIWTYIFAPCEFDTIPGSGRAGPYVVRGLLVPRAGRQVPQSGFGSGWLDGVGQSPDSPDST